MSRIPTIEAIHSQRSLAANNFDDPEWERAQSIPITRKWSGEEAPSSRHAEARIIWTDQALLVRFVCRQEEPLNVKPTPQLDKKTRRLWDGDVCEIFVAPDPNMPRRYFEFEASPQAEWVDLAINFTPAGRETDFEFHSGMTVGAVVAKGRTTVTMRIPWSASLPKPQRGDGWLVNLFRCVGLGNERYLAWQPTFTAEPNFHVPEVFGRLIFR